jgi:hypothetical protein
MVPDVKLLTQLLLRNPGRWAVSKHTVTLKAMPGALGLARGEGDRPYTKQQPHLETGGSQDNLKTHRPLRL